MLQTGAMEGGTFRTFGVWSAHSGCLIMTVFRICFVSELKLKIKLSSAADSHVTFPGDSRLVIWVLEFGAMC